MDAAPYINSYVRQAMFFNNKKTCFLIIKKKKKKKKKKNVCMNRVGPLNGVFIRDNIVKLSNF